MVVGAPGIQGVRTAREKLADMTSGMHIETKLLHGAYAPEQTTGATALPVFQSTSFAYESAEELEAVFAGRDAGFVYTRINNPTLDRFERRMTVLEDGLASV